jgi:tetratricopeptide (TPR) repeat protein
MIETWLRLRRRTEEAGAMIIHRSGHIGIVTAVALLGFAISAGQVRAAEGGSTSYPPPASGQKSDSGQKAKQGTKKKKQNQGELQQLREQYQHARALIMDGQYEAGIAAMHAIGDDDNAEIANFIGYASRKLGRYEDSKFWYEKALAADPKHVRTWSYYGMWHAEQGNQLMAKDFLEKVRLICGNTTCEEYTKLKGVIEGTQTY